MAALRSLSVLTLLLSPWGSQAGVQCYTEEPIHKTAGENVSLLCVIRDQDVNVVQIQWSKKTTADGRQGAEQMFLLYNPNFPVENKSNVSLHVEEEKQTGRLTGSSIVLPRVTVKDSGFYICDITTFPRGSIKRVTEVQVKEPVVEAKLSVGAAAPGGLVVEGSTVTISCVSSPSAQSYQMWPSKNAQLVLEEQSGVFTLPHVNRQSSDQYICQPKWSTFSASSPSYRAQVQLTVDYLDAIECNATSPTELSTGQSLTITCGARSSQSLQYTWTKDNETISHSASLSMTDVGGDKAGRYTLTAAMGNSTQLQQVEFIIRVLPQGDQAAGGQATSLPQPARNVSTTNATESRVDLPTHATPSESSTAPPAGTTRTNESYQTYPVPTRNLSTTEENMTIGSTAPSVCGNTTTQAGVSSGRGTSEQALDSAQGENNTVGFSTSGPATDSPTTDTATSQVTGPPVTNADSEGSGGYIALIILPILILLVLIAFLYRRYTIRKRMNLPPPFKPPPPPVKYNALRTCDIPMTGITH